MNLLWFAIIIVAIFAIRVVSDDIFHNVFIRRFITSGDSIIDKHVLFKVLFCYGYGTFYVASDKTSVFVTVKNRALLEMGPGILNH
ncbi:unnamed protein product [Leptidea sinapis]|uniref:Uncharacterized protein n=1 Tax=Leptidea sinapis TaxID=189913 RepID=A0A5E4PPN6_9NEOP|nr:unnamed protein product [Leptidea sinapis]